jgi:acyl-CoA thioester hydrolase
MTGTFAWPVRVYYEDTDAQGIVYFANYFKFAERARTEWLRHRGVDQTALRETAHRLFVVKSTSAEFHRPARYDDRLWVTTRVVERGGARFRLRQEVLRAGVGAERTDAPALIDTHQHERLWGSDVVVACLDARTMKPARLPALDLGDPVE